MSFGAVRYLSLVRSTVAFPRRDFKLTIYDSAKNFRPLSRPRGIPFVFGPVSGGYTFVSVHTMSLDRHGS
jgi:hypothetical protein